MKTGHAIGAGLHFPCVHSQVRHKDNWCISAWSCSLYQDQQLHIYYPSYLLDRTLTAACAALGSGEAALECAGQGPGTADEPASSALGDSDILELLRVFQVHALVGCCKPWKFCQLCFNNKARPADCKIIQRQKPCEEGMLRAILHCSGGRENLMRRLDGEWWGKLEPLTAVAGFMQPSQLWLSQCIIAFGFPSR